MSRLPQSPHPNQNRPEGERHAALRWAEQWLRANGLPLIPVCCHCRRFRDEAGEWFSISAVLLRHLEALARHSLLSHGICEPCLRLHYGASLGGEPHAP